MGAFNSKLKLCPPCGRFSSMKPNKYLSKANPPSSVYQLVCLDNSDHGLLYYCRGLLQSSSESAFSSKPRETVVQKKAEGLSALQIGVVCVKGKKEDVINQDDFAVFSTDNTRVLAVFDGHGPLGAKVSSFVQQAVIDSLIKVSLLKTDETTDSSIIRVFQEAHAACKLHAAVLDDKDKFDCVSSGTTATVAIADAEKVTIGFVGDSRCIVAMQRKEGTKEFDIVAETKDQTCDRKDEKRRIESRGGECRRLKGDIPRRVFVKDHGYPGLAMTRSIGDTSGEAAGIIPTPEIVKVGINHEKDQFIVVASDGVWEFLSSQAVVQTVSSFNKDSVQSAAEAVVKQAKDEWEKQSPWAIDDITCIIAWL